MTILGNSFLIIAQDFLNSVSDMLIKAKQEQVYNFYPSLINK